MGGSGQPRIQAADPSDKASFTFRVNHPPSRPQVDDTEVRMYLWFNEDKNPAMGMKRNSDGLWEVGVYLPTNGDIMYQYLLKNFDGLDIMENPLRRRKHMDPAKVRVDVHTEINDHWSALESDTVARHGAHAEDAPGQPSAGCSGPTPWVAELQGHDHRDSVLPPPAFENTKMYLARSSMAVSARASASGFQDCRGPVEAEAKAYRQSAARFSDCHETLEATPCDDHPTLEAAPCSPSVAGEEPLSTSRPSGGLEELSQAAAQLFAAENLVAGDAVQSCLATQTDGRDKVPPSPVSPNPEPLKPRDLNPET
jgi:hypothetical protein